MRLRVWMAIAVLALTAVIVAAQGSGVSRSAAAIFRQVYNTCSPGQLLLAAPGQLTGTSCGSASTTAGYNEFNVLDYGGVCNGNSDDTAALQAVLLAAEPTSGTVVLPAGTCTTLTPLVVGNLANGHAGGYSSISMRGQGPYSSSIHCGTGFIQTNNVCLTIRHMSAFRWEGFSVTGGCDWHYDIAYGGTNDDFCAGTVGIQVDGCDPQCTAGTNDTLQHFERIGISGFHTGMLQGGVNSASEVVCVNCLFIYNTWGFLGVTYNSLNFWFIGLHLVQNLCGIEAGGSSDAIKIFGGDSAANGKADGSEGADFCNGGFGTLEIDAFRSESPKLFRGNDGNPGTGNIYISNTVSTVIYGASAIEMANGSLVFESSQIGQVYRAGMIDASAMHSGTISVRNSTVRHSDDGYPFLPPSAVGDNSEVWTEAFGNQGYWDVSQGGPSGEAQCGKNAHLSSTAIICAPISGAFTATGFLVTPLPPEPGGHTVTFASAAAATVTFAKTVTVSTTGGTWNIGFSAGAITGADIGKPISVASAATDCGYGSVGPSPDTTVGWVKTAPTSTTATLQAGLSYDTSAHQCRNKFGSTSSYTATVGTVMPSATYAASLACDANETFWITGKSTTGLTVNSSNATSTATCTVLVGR